MQNEDNGGTREAVSTAVTDPEGQPFSVPTLVVGIGASAGGLQALERCFRQMPADTGLAFVVVVHLAPASESHLATLLQKCTAMPVVPMQRARELAPDQIYVIPPNCNLAMSDGMLRLLPLGAEHTRGGIDHFFRTLANAQGANAIGIVLSGTGSDGALGLSRIKEAGGMTIVQAPAEAEYDSMPQSAMSTGAVDLVLTVDEIVAKLVALGRRYSRGANTHTIAAPAVEEHDVLQQILALVRGQSGHDFTRYKPSSMMRRIGRRMQLHGIEQLTAYYAFLREERNEVQALFSDFLVTTTNFFRDAAAFAALSQQVIPALFEDKGSNDQVRVWTVGCATGEEAYSLAILLLEYAEQLENPPALQIFATDLSEEALRRARAGFYLDTIAMDLAPERLARFFVKESDGYRVGKELREIVLFATHSLLRDPPFSKIDLISCRNVLIYLQRSAQRQLLELFHYALVSDGYLFLGSAETTDTTALFQDVNRRCNIFQANRTESATVQWLAAPLVRPLAHPPVSFSQVNREGLSDAEIFHLQLLEECAPPRVIVNADYEIIYFSEGVSRYLYQPRGEPTNRVLRRICEELRVELTTALFRAFEHGEASQTQAVSLQFDGRKCWVVLDVRPALTPYRKGYAVLFFHEYADEAGVRNKSPQEEQTMRVLEEELQTLRLQLQTTVEEYEISKEEMRASHEELLSMNEELRLTTEELETSKEELQSINEELFAVNRELKNKVAEVTQSNNNFQNLLISTDIATLFLDRTLRIAFYTPPTTALFNFIPPDRGRPFAHLRTNLHDTQLEADARQVLAELRPVEREVQSLTGQWFLMRMRPYRTAANQIEGVVITFVDITERKAFEERQGQLLQEIEQHRSRLRILNQALATAQENERKGLVRTLHDRVGQSLVALNLTLKLIQQEIATQLSPSSQAQTRIVEAQRFIKEVTEQIRNVMAELHPPMLDDYGLLATLKWYANKLGQQSNIRVDVQGPEFTERLGENTEVTLFRIAQEAMTNAVKHGQPSSITVAVAVDGHQIKLQITDNGRGIGQNDGANAVIRPGWGILSMQERATAIGGRLRIESQPDEGTTVTVEVER